VLFVLTLLLAQASSGGGWSTGRPPECGEPGGRASNVWERAKSPELRRYCDLVASAASKLAGTASMAEQALASAQEADTVLPGHAAPRVLAGRALEALGKLDEALAALEDGRTREPGALDDPLALARTGKGDRASDAYRALLPRASSLSALERSTAAVAAGRGALARGPARIDEAAAALREGLREAQDERRVVAVLALALALDRRGDAEESRALLSERAHGDPRAPLASAQAKDLLSVAPAEAQALAALALEPTDAAGARDAWQAYLDTAPQSPWAPHARTHLTSLGGKRTSPRPPRR
jgi:tetratricopeptide (TPR) repeat protein